MGNIVFIRGIWLDFEAGDLKPDEFPDLFPDTRMAIFNTFNHTTEAPRFRVVIPTKDIMTPEAYSLIWEQIEFKLNAQWLVSIRMPRACRLGSSSHHRRQLTSTS
jgi:hypothetical protein